MSKRRPLHRRHRYVLGIDPGRTTGIAVYDRDEERLCGTYSGEFWKCWDFVRDNYSPADTTVRVENPKMNAPVFHHGVDHAEFRKRSKIARNVGENQGHAQMWIDGLKAKHYEVVEVRPQSAKWDAGMVKRYTGYDGRPNNQHVRDAIKMVWQL